MQYTITIPQLPELQKAFAQAPEITKREVTTAVNRSLISYQASIKGNSPFLSGRLRSSVTINPAKANGNTIEGSVGPHTNYAIHVEQGTGIYGPNHAPIRPKRAKVLAFKSGGKMVFARSIKGMRGRFFVKRAADSGQSRTEGYFQKALENVAAALLKGGA